MELLSQKYIKIIADTIDDINIVKVIDNAGGIPEKLLNKVFNPYFTTKEEGKGTGIGLYMTKTIMDKHFRGSIEVSNSDDGAIFTLVLPKDNDA
jgi:two-component system, NtrC family, C4-dicarboxylate transport sensor histidine kinase DctB